MSPETTQPFASTLKGESSGHTSSFLDAIAVRRSYYSLSNALPSHLTEDKVKDLIGKCILHTPTSFNTQSGTVVILYEEKSAKHWDLVMDLFLPTLPNDDMKNMYKEKIPKEYASGYGTVLFFEDHAVLEASAQKNPSLAQSFYNWSSNSTGILQSYVWVALTNEGLGCSLQHYGEFAPNINPTISKEYGLPESWKCTAMMPFGVPTGNPGKAPDGSKAFAPLEDRLKVL